MDRLTAMLSETTLNNMAFYGPNAEPTPSDLDDDDNLWGPRIGITHAEDTVVPLEMQILPDPRLRQYLSDLYYEVR